MQTVKQTMSKEDYGSERQIPHHWWLGGACPS